MRSKKPKGDGLVCENRKARYKYHILETYEAGIALSGDEVKSIRMGQASISEAFARTRNGEVWLENFQIPGYAQASHNKPDPLRSKKLLLHKREIMGLIGEVQREGRTLVPLKVYFNDRGLAKVLLGVASGKQHQDRRQDIIERDSRRETDRALKEFSRRS